MSHDGLYEKEHDKVAEKQNRYDKKDMVSRQAIIKAGPLQIAAYKVRDPETMEWSGLQFHMTFHGMILAVMEENTAKLFAKFVEDCTNGK